MRTCSSFWHYSPTKGSLTKGLGFLTSLSVPASTLVHSVSCLLPGTILYIPDASTGRKVLVTVTITVSPSPTVILFAGEPLLVVILTRLNPAGNTASDIEYPLPGTTSKNTLFSFCLRINDAGLNPPPA